MYTQHEYEAELERVKFTWYCWKTWKDKWCLSTSLYCIYLDGTRLTSTVDIKQKIISSICSTELFSTVFLIFVMFKVRAWNAVRTPAFLAMIFWVNRCHMVTKCEKDSRVSCFLSINLTFPDKKKQNKCTFLACALYLPFSWIARKKAQFQRRNCATQKARSRAPKHPTANAVLLQQEARTQVGCKASTASLSSCCQLNIGLYEHVYLWK